MKKSNHERYSLERSPFFKLREQKRLAALLGYDKVRLSKITAYREFHYRDRTEEIGGKRRNISVPVGEMRKIHDRIADLLGRIQLPDYVFSPRKGRGVIHNALHHRDSEDFLQLDIEKFYPSTSREHVFQFFLHKLQMSEDVAGHLSKLCTFEGRLPFGSPLSPILCVFTHLAMFDRINDHVCAAGCKMSVWVDDINISGKAIRGELIAAVKSEIRRRGLRYHKVKRRNQAIGVEVTGVVMQRGVLKTTKRFDRTFAELRDAYQASSNTAEKQRILQSLLGKANYARSVAGASSSADPRLTSRWSWLRNEMRQMQRATVRTLPINALPASDDASLPWNE